MLDTIHSIILKKNAISQEYFHIFKNDNINISFVSAFDTMTKSLLSKEIEFNNISTKEKKKHENTLSKNFFINHLINIFYRQDVFLKNGIYHVHKNDFIQKKKMNDHFNISAFYKNNNNQLKDIKRINNNIKYPITANIDNINDKNTHNNYSVNASVDHISKQGYEKNVHRHILNNTSFIDLYKNNSSIMKNTNSMISFIKLGKENNKDYYNASSLLKNINKLENNVQKNFFVKNFEKEKDIDSVLHPFLYNDLKNIIEWKKAISQQTLFFIFQKENIAEIQVRPPNVKPIYVKIQMKNDQATVNFISHHLPMKNFLYNAIPFLRDSLVEHGVKIDTINVHGIVSKDDLDTKIQYDNKQNKYILKMQEVENVFNYEKKNVQYHNYRGIDVYV